MKKKNIVYIPVMKFYPTYAGWIKQTLNLIERLPGLYFLVETNLISKTSKSEFLYDNLKVNRLKNISKSYNFFGKTYFLLIILFRLIKNRKKITCVYFPFSYYPAEGLIIICKILGLKTICRLSGGEIGEYEKKLSTKIRLFSYKKANRIIVLNQGQKKYLLVKGLKESQIYFIPNAVDLHEFQAVKISNLTKSLNGLSNEKIIVGYVGYMTERKGLMVLLESLQKLSTEYQDRIQLLIIGPDEPISGEEDYYNLVNSSIEKSKFDVIKVGKVDSIIPYYKLMDIYVLPSKFEGMPNALIEAMASAVASVGSSIPGIVDVIKHKKTGLLFEADNSSDLCEKIEFLVKEKEKRKKISKAGLRSIQINHNIDSTKLIYKELFT